MKIIIAAIFHKLTGCKIILILNRFLPVCSNGLYRAFHKNSLVLILSIFLTTGYATAATAQLAENKPQYILTVEQREQVEKSWSKALSSHAEKITLSFSRAMPDNYHDFATFRKNDWQPKFDRDWNIARNGFASFADRNTVEYQKLRDISNAFFHLNAASLDMLRYLRSGDKELLASMREQLRKVEVLDTKSEQLRKVEVLDTKSES